MAHTTNEIPLRLQQTRFLAIIVQLPDTTCEADKTRCVAPSTSAEGSAEGAVEKPVFIHALRPVFLACNLAL